MAKIDKTYAELLAEILNNGRKYEDPNRKDVHRLQIPHYTFIHDFKDGFPAITTKKLYWKGVVGELLWFLKGDTNIKYLVDNGINIWNKDAYNYYLKICKEFDSKPGLNFDECILAIKHNVPSFRDSYKFGNCGRIYGAQWRRFSKGIEMDQISNLIKNLKEKPLGTDHIVTAWNPTENKKMALPPCHKGFQIMVYPLTLKERCLLGNWNYGKTISDLHCDKQNLPKYGFDLVWEQRSVDTFLGLPFNIASYALLAQIIGKMVNMVPGKIIGDLRNVHLYENSLEGVKEQLSKDVNKYNNCQLDMINRWVYNDGTSVNKVLDLLKISEFRLKNYESYPAINVEMLNRD